MSNSAIFWMIVGLLFLAGGLYCLWRRRRAGRDAARMSTTETSRAADIADKSPGAQVEVKGVVRCTAPVTGELSRQPCAHAVATVIREYVQRRRDSQGRMRSHRMTEIISSNVLVAPFMVEDESGQVVVDARQGPTIEGVQTVNRFEPHRENVGVVQSVIGAFAGGEETLGFRHTEMILPLEAQVYVLGIVKQGGIIGGPEAGGEDAAFVISTQTEEQRTATLEAEQRWLLYGLLGCLAAAAVAFTIALWTSNSW